MIAIVCVLLGCVLLWAWLSGHWFARVLMFLLLGIIGFVGGASAINYGLYDGHATAIVPGLLGGIVGAALAWPISSIPINRRQANAVAEGFSHWRT